MWYYILKILSSSVILVAVSEISKRSSLMGSILASIPLVSVLAFIWLYLDTKDVKKVIELSNGIFWLVIPSLVLFVALPIFLKRNVNFGLSLTFSVILMVISYFIMIFILKKFGINL